MSKTPLHDLVSEPKKNLPYVMTIPIAMAILNPPFLQAIQNEHFVKVPTQCTVFKL